MRLRRQLVWNEWVATGTQHFHVRCAGYTLPHNHRRDANYQMRGYVRYASSASFGRCAMQEVMACQHCGQVWERDCNASLNVALLKKPC